MPKVFTLCGHTLDELKGMSTKEFAKLVRASERRKLLRGLTEEERKLLEAIRREPEKFHRTHLREMIILPQMVGAKIGVYVGGGKSGEGAKESERWSTVVIKPEMIGHRLGEFAITTKKVKHSAPGVGATRGSKFFASKT
ncbi:MAG: ribosomal protein S19 family protein [Candidatus Aenigmarchaeota archaeon]|nr:ribosomal protein S19 family protein [Candidatus Aenigmarchaeota archaeon]